MADKKRSVRKILIAVFALITLLTAAVAITGQAPRIRLSLAKNGQVCDGILPDVKEHIKKVPEGEIRYLINKNMVFESAYSQGNVMLENPESCEYDLKFIVYDSEGKAIYISPVLKPGQYLETDKLMEVVKPGVYECSYSAEALKEGKSAGQVTGLITVTVK